MADAAALRQLLERLAFSDDPRISPSDRVRAAAALSELPASPEERQQVAMSEEQLLEELAGFGLPGAVAVALGPEHVVPPESHATQLQQTVGVLRTTERRLASAQETIRACRAAFVELLGGDPGEATVEKVAEALRRIREEDVTDAEVVDEPRELPDGSR